MIEICLDDFKEKMQEEEFDLDLGEGYIPLPKGNYEESSVVVIDEDYILDEYEMDLIDNNCFVENYTQEQSKESNIVVDNEPLIDLNEAKSIVSFSEENETVEDLTNLNLNSDDVKIANSIAKEYIENFSNDVLLGEEYNDESDDASWVDDPDLFGNDISVIIAEDPNAEFVEEDYVDGSFEDWLNQNSVDKYC